MQYTLNQNGIDAQRATSKWLVHMCSRVETSGRVRWCSICIFAVLATFRRDGPRGATEVLGNGLYRLLTQFAPANQMPMAILIDDLCTLMLMLAKSGFEFASNSADTTQKWSICCDKFSYLSSFFAFSFRLFAVDGC